MKKIKSLFLLLVVFCLLPVSIVSAEVIGVWSGKYVAGNFLYDQIKIEKNADSYKMTQKLKDGGSRVVYLRKSGDKFIDSNGSDYYTVNSSGSLSVCDSQGVIFTLPTR